MSDSKYGLVVKPTFDIKLFHEGEAIRFTNHYERGKVTKDGLITSVSQEYISVLVYNDSRLGDEGYREDHESISASSVHEGRTTLIKLVPAEE